MVESNYIHADRVLSSIYADAVGKFMSKAENQLCFDEICEYVHRKLQHRKQDGYTHSLAIVKEVCKKVGENFDGCVEYYAPNAKCYRDIYFAIYN
jgi:hypothetical protein